MTVFDLSLITRAPGIVAIVAALVAGAALGGLNGLLIVRLRVSPFIVTLAAMATWRGTTYAISGRQLHRDLSVAPITDKLLLWIDKSFGPIPRAFVYMLLLGLAAYWVLQHTEFGHDIYSVGGNERVAYPAGIDVARVKITAYAISGLCAEIAALILTSRLSTSPVSSPSARANGLRGCAVCRRCARRPWSTCSRVRVPGSPVWCCRRALTRRPPSTAPATN